MISGAKYYYTKSCTKLRFYTRYNISLTMDYEKKSNTPTVLRPVEFSGRNKKKKHATEPIYPIPCLPEPVQ